VRKKNRVQHALTEVTDMVLRDASPQQLEQAQKRAEKAGATDEQFSEAFWNARRTLQGMTP
jgi:hypothetical protein